MDALLGFGRQPAPARDAVLEEYARLAGQYEQRWLFYVRATTRETLARLRVTPTDSVLDVGCGTGALLDELSASFPRARLAGIDPCPEMLAIARGRLPPVIELKQGWAERIPYPDCTFDVVVSCNVLHYLREPLVALRDMLRVLRPEGTLVITDWCADYLACRICDWHLRLFNAAHFQTYPARKLRNLLHTAGASEIRIDRYKISWLWGLMTATARQPELTLSHAAYPPGAEVPGQPKPC
jgi:ubiquinone/menaquinone biosynthesis C-methylase UbiE